MKRYWRKLSFFIIVILLSNGLISTKDYLAEAYTIDINSLDSTWTIIDEAYVGSGYLNQLLDNLMANGKNKFFIRNGNYYLNDTIIINYPNVMLWGESNENARMIQTNAGAMGIKILSDNVQINGIYLDNQIGREAISAYDVNNVSIQNSVIYGSNANTALAFYGKYVTNENDAVENSDLNNNNRIIGNTIYSALAGDVKDGLFFSKQMNGLVKDNSLTGSRIAFYLSRNSEVSNNTITNSESNGIRYGVPGYDNKIINNNITNTKASGIVTVRNDTGLTPNTYRASNLTIRDNTISDTRYFGIEISNLKNSIIENNTIENTDFYGIYLLFADYITVQNNVINESSLCDKNGILWSWDPVNNAGIFLDYMVTNSVFNGNDISNEDDCPYGIKIQSGGTNINNQIINNRITGNYDYGISANEGTPENTIVYGNLINLKVKKIPQNVSAVVSGSSILVTWDAEPDALGYEVNADGGVIDNGFYTSFEDANLLENSTHKYKVRLKGGDWSSEITVTMPDSATGTPTPTDAITPSVPVPTNPPNTPTPTDAITPTVPVPTSPPDTPTPTDAITPTVPVPTSPTDTPAPTDTITPTLPVPTSPPSTQEPPDHPHLPGGGGDSPDTPSPTEGIITPAPTEVITPGLPSPTGSEYPAPANSVTPTPKVTAVPTNVVPPHGITNPPTVEDNTISNSNTKEEEQGNSDLGKDTDTQNTIESDDAWNTEESSETDSDNEQVERDESETVEAAESETAESDTIDSQSETAEGNIKDEPDTSENANNTSSEINNQTDGEDNNKSTPQNKDDRKRFNVLLILAGIFSALILSSFIIAKYTKGKKPKKKY